MQLQPTSPLLWLSCHPASLPVFPFSFFPSFSSPAQRCLLCRCRRRRREIGGLSLSPLSFFSPWPCVCSGLRPLEEFADDDEDEDGARCLFFARGIAMAGRRRRSLLVAQKKRGRRDDRLRHYTREERFNLKCTLKENRGQINASCRAFPPFFLGCDSKTRV